MQFEVTVEKKEKQTIEVEFPLYLQGGDTFDGGGWYQSFYRIDVDPARKGYGVEHHLNIDSRGEWQYEKSNINLSNTLGCMLVQSKHDYTKITADEFYKQLEKLKAALIAIPPK